MNQIALQHPQMDPQMAVAPDQLEIMDLLWPMEVRTVVQETMVLQQATEVPMVAAGT